MLHKEFKENLIKSVSELGFEEYGNMKIIITPIDEPGKKLNSKDDYMRLGVFTEKNLKDRYFDLSGAAKILSHPDLYYPIWITVELIEEKDNEYIIELKVSRRFRTQSTLQNQETGHPPFKVLKNNN